MKLAALFCLLLGLGAFAPPVERDRSSSRRPNVLVLVADDISDRDLDHLNTPAVDWLASRGVRFRRAYGAPVCSQARRALQFGEFFSRDAGGHCGFWRARAPSMRQPNLARLFSSQGYATGFFGKWHLGSYPGASQGFPWQEVVRRHGYDTWRAGIPQNVDACVGGSPKNYWRWQRVDDDSVRTETRYVTDAIRDAFLGWTEEVRGTPWFATVSFQSPHRPFHDPPHRPLVLGGPRAKYEAMVEYLDIVIGEILATLDLRDTVVLFVADNGTPSSVPGPGQAANRVKQTTYEDGIRVPMVWAGPGIPAGRESTALFPLVDVLPTFAAALGVKVREGHVDGVSQARVLADPTQAMRARLFAGVDNATTTDHAVVTPRFKYRETQGVPSLFDLAADPFEEADLAADPAWKGVRATLAQELARFRAGL